MGVRLVALDRDGTLIRWKHHLTRVEEIELLPGAADAIRALNDANVLVALYTNQSVVGRGMISWEDLSDLHANLSSQLRSAGARLDHILVCPHRPSDDCRCRKPAPFLLLNLMRELGMETTEVALIGDTDVDMQTAESAEVLGMRIKSDHPRSTLVEGTCYRGVLEAVNHLLKTRALRE